MLEQHRAQCASGGQAPSSTARRGSAGAGLQSGSRSLLLGSSTAPHHLKTDMNRLFCKMPTKTLRSVGNPFPLLLSTIQKLGQSALHTFSRYSWMRYTLPSLALLIWLTTSNANLYQTGDTQGWISGAEWLKDCILLVSSEVCQRISYWPIWNNSLALMFSWFTGNQIKLWYYLNVISFVVYLLVIVESVRQFYYQWRFFIVYSILFSPLLFQVNSTFTEIQQGLFLTLALLSFIKGRKKLSSIFIFLSIATKETFILLWGVILIFQIIKEMMNILKIMSIRAPLDGFSDTLTHLFRIFLQDIIKIPLFNNKIRSLIIGILLGSLVNFGFNYLRYQQFKNTSYYSLNILFSMDFNYVILNFIWSLISPNGGIIFSYGIFLTVTILYLIGHQTIQLSEFINVRNPEVDFHY